MTTKRPERYYGLADLERELGPMTIGRIIRAWRLCDEMSQAEYARRLGISPGNLCDIEKGRQLISARKAAEIADKIGYSRDIMVELAINEQLAHDGLKIRVKVQSPEPRSRASKQSSSARRRPARA